MDTFYLEVKDGDDPASVHQRLRTLLAFPDYYGCNLDALSDCLGERREKGRLWIRGNGGAAMGVQTLLQGVSSVFEANGFSVSWLD